MTALDFAKALLTAVMLMVVNVAASFAVVAAYSFFVDPGHDAAYYESAAQRIVPWSSVVVGMILFGLAGFVSARRRPERNAILFSAVCAFIYVGIDALLLYLTDSLQALGAVVPISYATKITAALLGAQAGATRAPSG
jgi:hypothetical protein